MASPLPESKFQPPVARPGIVARTALVGQLLATRAPVITVVAPPGYGKTTLMAQWAERIGPRAAWLSCDEGDNDPVVLLSALAIALDRIAPVDPGIFSALASSGADITAIPRFVAAVASVRSPVTVALAQLGRDNQARPVRRASSWYSKLGVKEELAKVGDTLELAKVTGTLELAKMGEALDPGKEQRS